MPRQVRSLAGVRRRYYTRDPQAWIVCRVVMSVALWLEAGGQLGTAAGHVRLILVRRSAGA